MARSRRKEWTDDEEQLLIDTVKDYLDKGKSITDGLKKAGRLLKRRLGPVRNKYGRIKVEVQEPGESTPRLAGTKRPYVKVKAADQKTVEVVGGTFALAASTKLGLVSVSENQVTIVWDDENTVIKVTQSKTGLVVSKL